MKNLAIIIMLAGCFLATTTLAWASVTFFFDPNDLIDLYPGSAGYSDVVGENKSTQPNARRVHEGWKSTFYETFYNPDAPHTQPDDYNTYMNWRDSLGLGEGISAFNIWLLDNPNARSWGEKTVWNPEGSAPNGTADSDDFWNVEVIENPWGPGWLVQWWTTDQSKLLRPGGADIGEFSFSGIAYWDNNENGYDVLDPEVQVGEDARIWFGSYWGAQPEDWNGEDHSMAFDDQGFGTRVPNYGSFQPVAGADGSNVGWEGVLSIQAVPEPTSILLLGIGLIGLAGGRARKKIMG